jgi:hypothetical protein
MAMVAVLSTGERSHGPTDGEHPDRVDADEHGDEHRVGDRAADDPVDVVEAIPEDRDPDPCRHREQHEAEQSVGDGEHSREQWCRAC